MQKSNSKINNEIKMPKPSVIYSEKFRVGLASGVASIVVFVLSFYLADFSETTGTRDIGMVFAVLVGIVPYHLSYFFPVV